jgi:hypothetical protein
MAPKLKQELSGGVVVASHQRLMYNGRVEVL